MGIGAAIKAICDLIAAFLKARSEGKPEREKRERDDEFREINRIVGEKDLDAIAARIAAIRHRLSSKDRVPPGKQ